MSPRRNFDDSLKEAAAWLHTFGYKYTGPGCLYGLTFVEIARLSDGTRMLQLTADGVTAGEEAMFDRLSEEWA